MEKVKFDEFYFKDENRILDINIIKEYARKNDGNIKKYQDRIFCPECKKARLTFVNGYNSQYLRATRIKEHEESCTYNYEYEEDKIVREYINNLDGMKIKNKLISVINILNKEQISKNDSKTNSFMKIEKNPFIIQEGKERKVKSIRIKKISSNIDDEDNEKICLLYGEAKINNVKNENKKEKTTFYTLQLSTYDLKNKIWKVKLSVNYNKKIDVDRDAIYYIAMIGEININIRNERKYINVKLIKNAIIYKKIDK